MLLWACLLDSLNDTAYFVIHEIQIWRAVRPHVLGPGHHKVLLAPFLDKIARMSWSSIFLPQVLDHLLQDPQAALLVMFSMT